jgi:hypothetical protein
MHIMKKKLAGISAIALSAFAPVLAFAQVSSSSTAVCNTNSANAGIETVICQIYRIINIAIPVLILFGVAYLIYGIIMFVIAGDGEEKGNAKSVMIHGIIGLAVIFSIWGLVRILQSTFGLSNSSGPGVLPTF